MAITPVANPPEEVAGLRRLMAEFRMDYGAADFKTDPATGKLVFLELKSSPMFARFDLETNGLLSTAIVETLVNARP